MFIKLLFTVSLVTGAFADSTQWDDIVKKCIESQQNLFLRAPVPLQYLRCVNTVFNVEEVKNALEEAKANGTLKDLIKSYCDRSQELKNCISNTTMKLVPCMEKGVSNQINAPYKEMVDFACHDDGERLYSFINEGGVECFKEKSDSILNCLGVQVAGLDVLEFMVLSVAAQCTRFEAIAPCVSKGLKECSSPVPADLASALFDSMRNYMKCEKQKN